MNKLIITLGTVLVLTACAKAPETVEAPAAEPVIVDVAQNVETQDGMTVDTDVSAPVDGTVVTEDMAEPLLDGEVAETEMTEETQKPE